ncbi:MAG TPA: glycine cleavage T C-terminal barrel domain-containing protein [Thermoanaerobaculia bacterium]|nr:glycine cleavage T C-terminal barrel domain-containing protein [Thermoanaerobaculia bacterium]
MVVEAARSDGALTALLDELGAAWAELGGGRVPAHFGAAAEEHAALEGGLALVPRPAAGLLEIAGEDRRRFLHGLVTCDVQGLQPGGAIYCLLTSHQGRILADAAVLARPDALWLELPPGRQEAIAAHLGKYVIADRVEIGGRGDRLPLTLVGAPAAAAAGVDSLAGEPWSSVEGEAYGVPVVADRRPLAGLPALTLWVAAPSAGELARRLLDAGRDGGLRPVGWEALEAARVERGVPRWGRDYGEEHFPQEAGLEEQAVSYTKGCYLGQEVIARIHYRGQVNRVLRGVLVEGRGVPPEGSELLYDGRPLGRLTSVVQAPCLGRVAGLAIVHRRGADPGTRVDIAGGGAGEITALPFV